MVIMSYIDKVSENFASEGGFREQMTDIRLKNKNKIRSFLFGGSDFFIVSATAREAPYLNLSRNAISEVSLSVKPNF
jgi:hypothetical protein